MADILLFLTMGLSTTTLGFAIAWLRARDRATRAEGILEGIRGVTRPQTDLTPAIDVIAMEVERIGEGQRFLTKILAEQQNTRLAQPRPQGSITPH